MTSFNTRDSGGYGSVGGGGEGGPGPGAPVPQASRLVQLAGAASAVALILGVVVWGYKLAVRDVSGVPVIRAMQGPARIAPEDPGGDLAAHVGLAVNEVAGTGLAAPGPERVVLAPEAEGLAPDDAPMAALRPLPSPKPRPAAPAPQNGAAAPVPDLTGTPEAEAAVAPVPEGADGVAAAEDEAPLAATATEPAPEPAPAAAPAAIASTTGVVRSPRPLPRPQNRDLVAEAAARAVAEAMGGGASESLDIDPATLPEGTRVVQLGAFDSAEIARSEWDRIATRFEPLMEGKKRIVQEAVSGGRSFWRLRVQGFETVEDARRFCAALVAEGANCVPTLAK